jgi:hypothetical protein
MSKNVTLDNIPQIHDTTVLNLSHPITRQNVVDSNGDRQWIRVYGMHSDHMEHERISLQRRMMQDAVLMDSAEVEAQVDALTEELLVKSIVEWNIEIDGKHLELTEANVKYIFKRHIWLKQRINSMTAQMGNFMES